MACPFFPQVKYIVVGRDARDVAMSMWNHYSEFTDGVFEGTNNMPDQVGDPFSLPPPGYPCLLARLDRTRLV